MINLIKGKAKYGFAALLSTLVVCLALAFTSIGFGAVKTKADVTPAATYTIGAAADNLGNNEYSSLSAGWSAAIQKSLDLKASNAANTLVKVVLANNWTATADATLGTTFGSGTGFQDGRLKVPEGSNIVLDLSGFTIDRGLYAQTDPTEYGQVIFLNNAQFTLEDSSAAQTGTITGANSDVQGGAIFVTNNSQFTMNGGTVIHNKTTCGGGAAFVNTGCTFTMNGGKITENTGVNSSGGGLFVISGTFNMTGGEIFKNITAGSGDGGGILLHNTGAKGNISGGKIYDNTAVGKGGGIYLMNYIDFTMSNGEIYGNHADSGAGIAASLSKINMTGGYIYGHESASNGGGVFIENSSTFTMSGGEIHDNKSTYANAGGAYSYGSTVTLTGGKIYKNASSRVDGMSAGGVMVSGGKLTADGTEFYENDGYAYGGALCGVGSEINILSGKFHDNIASSGAVVMGNGLKLNISGGEFYNNTGRTCGGAIDLHYTSVLNMTGGKFYGNRENGTYYGGGVFNLWDGPVANISGGTIGGTTEAEQNVSILGGAIFGYNAKVNISGTAEIIGNKSEVRDRDGTPMGGLGGGIFLNGGSELTISGGKIANNSAPEKGGAVHLDGSALTMTGGQVSGNTAHNGAAFNISGSVNAEITGGVIGGDAAAEGNVAGYAAGAMYIEQYATGRVTIGGTAKISYNRAETADTSGASVAGAIMLGAKQCELVMEGGEISHNSGNGNTHGGAIAIYNGAKITLKGGKISNNTSNHIGGAIYLADSCELVMDGGEISGNTAKNSGGGVFVNTNSTFTLNGGKISGNSVTAEQGNGGGIYAISTTHVTMNGGEISGNTSYYATAIRCENANFVMNGGIISDNYSSFAHNKCTAVSIFGSLYLYGGVITKNRGNTQDIGLAGQVWGLRTYIKGSPKVYGNTQMDGTTPCDLTFGQNTSKAVIEGSLAGAKIGVHDVIYPDSVFTVDYSKYNAGVDPSTIFFSDAADHQIAFNADSTEAVWTTGSTTQPEVHSLNWRVSYFINGVWTQDYKFTDTSATVPYRGSAINTAVVAYLDDTETVISNTDNAGNYPYAKTEYKDRGGNKLYRIGNAGTYNFEVPNPDSSGRLYSNPTFTLTIEPITLGVTWTEAEYRYTGGVQAPTATFTGALTGDRVQPVVDMSNAGTNVGGYTVEVTDIMGAAANNYLLPNSGRSKAYNILPKQLTAPTAISGLTYNGSEQLIVNGFDPDTMTATGGIGTDNIYGKAGNYTVNVALRDSVNYEWKTGGNAAQQLSVSMAKAKLIVSGVTADDKAYDGTVTAMINVGSATLDGIYGTDNVTLSTDTSAITSTFDNANVGVHTVTITGLQLAGADAANYELYFTYTHVSASITPAAITVTADNQSLTYGDEPSSLTNTYQITAGALCGSDSLGTPQYTVGYSKGGNAGTYNGAIAVSGLYNPNYTITFVAGNLTVNKKAVNVTIDETSATSVYGADLAEIKYTCADLVNGDNLGLKFNKAAGNTVGDYAITVDDSAKNANYTYTVTNPGAKYTITKAPLTVTTKSGSTSVGAFPADFATNGFGLVVDGLKNGDSAATLVGTYAAMKDASTQATTTDLVSGATFEIKFTASTTDADAVALLANYNVTYVNGTLYVVATSSVTVTVNAMTAATYDKTAKLTSVDLANVSSLVTVSGAGIAVSDVTLKLYKADGVTEITSATDAGKYIIKASVSDALKTQYNPIFVDCVFEIKPAAITVTVTAASIVYGADPTAANLYTYTVTAGNYQTGDDLGTASYTVGYARYGKVGTYTGAITAYGLSNANYTITYVAGDLTVTAKAVTVAIDETSATSVYGADIAEIKYTATGLENNDSLGVKFTKAAGDTVGDYAIAADDSAKNENYTYTVTNPGAKYTITKAPLTVTTKSGNTTVGALPANFADNGFGLVIEGLKNGDDGSKLVGTYAAMKDASTQATTTDLVSGASFDIKFTASNAADVTAFLANYNVTYASGKLYVVATGAVTVSVNAMTAATYDKTAKLTQVYLDGNVATLVTISGAGIAASDVTLKLYKESDLTTPVASATDAGKYVIKATVSDELKAQYSPIFVDCIFEIKPTAITVTVTAKTITYGDDPTAANLYTYTVTSGTLYSGDDLGTAQYTVGYARYGKVGTYTGAISAYGLSNANYTITYVAGDLTVNKKAVNVTIDETSATSVYGADIAEIKYTCADLVNGDNLGLKFKKADGNTVGDYAITVDDSAKNENYTYTVTNSGAKYKITKAPLTVTTKSGNTTVGALPADFADNGFGLVIEGLKNGDQAATLVGTYAAMKDASNAVTTADLVGGASFDIKFTASSDTAVTAFLANYNVTYVNGTLYVVATSSVTVTVNAMTAATYDKTAKLTQAALASDVAGKITISGAGIAASDVTLKLYAADGTTPVTSATDAGRYVIKATVSDELKARYSPIFVDCMFEIKPAAITVTVTAASIVYGADPTAATYAYTVTSGTLYSGDDLGTASYTVGYARYGKVGTYTGAISAYGLSNANYTITYVAGDLTVTAKAVTVAIDETSATSVYGADIAEIKYTVTGLENNDSLGVKFTKAAGDTVGDYTITADDSAKNENYTYTVTNPGAKYTITKAPLTVTTKSGNTTVGALPADFADNGFGLVIEGLKNGDQAATLVGTYAAMKDASTQATTTDLVSGATFEIKFTASSDTAVANLLANYNVTYVNGTLYVVATSSVTVTVNAMTAATYDKTAKLTSVDLANVSSLVTVSGAGIAVSDVTLKLYKADGVTEITSATDAGRYVIKATVSDELKAQYSPIFVDCVFEIKPTAITVTVTAKTITYGDDPTAATYAYTVTSGTQYSGDDLGTASYTVGYARYGKVGTYTGAISAYGLSNANYTITYVAGDLTVTAKAVTVAIDETSATSVYGSDIAEIKYTVTGLENNDSLGVKFTKAAGDTVGDYTITADNSAKNENYTYTVTNLGAKYKITKAPLTVTTKSGNTTVGALPANFADNGFGLVIEGLKNGDDGSKLVGTYAAMKDASNAVTTADLVGGASFDINFTASTTDADAVALLANYNVTYASGKLYVVATGAVTVSVNAMTAATYDKTAKLTQAALASDVAGKITISGAGIAASDVTLKLYKADGVTEITSATDAGKYIIKATVSDELKAQYSPIFVDCIFEIKPTAITVTVTAKTITYGDDPTTATYAYTVTSGTLYSGDDLGTESYSVGYSRYGKAGTYTGAITAYGLSNANYTITYVAGDLTVDKKSATVTLGGVTKTYGDALAEIAYTCTDLVNGDSLGLVLKKAADGTQNANTVTGMHAGTYAILADVSALNANYTLTNITGWTVTANANEYETGYNYTIDKKKVVFTAKSGSVDFETATASGFTANLGFIVDGLASGDGTEIFKVAYTLDPATITATGDYTIKITSVTAADGKDVEFANYTYNVSELVDGKLTVTSSANVTITIDSKTGYYGEHLVELTFVSSNTAVTSSQVSLWIEVPTEIKADGKLTAADGINLPAGSYIIRGSVSGSAYNALVLTGSYTVKPRPVKVTVENKTLTYGDDPADSTKLTNSYTVALGDAESGLTLTGGAMIGTDTLGTGSYVVGYARYGKVDTYAGAINVTGLDNKNYAIVEITAGDLTVTKRDVTVTINAATSAYGEDIAEIGYTANGLVNGDNLGLVINKDGAAVTVGDYNVIVDDSALNANYNTPTVTNPNVKYTITRAQLTITANAGEVEYGDTPVWTKDDITAVGFAAGEDISVLETELSRELNFTYASASSNMNVGTTDYVATPYGFGPQSANYDIHYVAGAITVKAKPVTIKTDDATSAYGEDSALVQNGWSFVAGSATPDRTELAVTLKVVDASGADVTVNGADMGLYLIAGESSNDNYALTVVKGTYKITARVIYSVQWTGNTGVSGTPFAWAYNGTAQGPTAKFQLDPTDTTKTIAATVQGLQTNAGDSYTAYAVLTGADVNNYVFASGFDNSHAFQILKAELNVKWKAQSSSSDEFTGTNADEIKFNFTNSAQAPVPVFYLKSNSSAVTLNANEYFVPGFTTVGTHTATLSFSSLNYEIVDGATCLFKIVAVDVSNFQWYDKLPTDGGIVITEGTFVFNGEAQRPVATATGMQIAYIIKSVNTLTDAETEVTEAKNAGTYKAYAYSLTQGYDIPAAKSSIKFTITPLDVTVEWSVEENHEFEYTGMAQSPVAYYTDAYGRRIELRNFDSVSDLILKDDQGAPIVSTLTAGTYTATIKPERLSDGNYNFDTSVRTYVITPKNLTITWDNDSGDWVADTQNAQVLAQEYSGADVVGSVKFTGSLAQTYASEKDEISLARSIKKDGVAVSEIKDAGYYEVSVNLVGGSGNYRLVDATKTYRILPKALTVTVSAPGEIKYQSPTVNYSVAFSGFVTGEDENSLGLKDSDGKYYWLTNNYSVNTNPGSQCSIDLTQNAINRARYEEALKNYNVTFVKGVFVVKGEDGDVKLVGWKTDVQYFIYDGESHVAEAFYKTAESGSADPWRRLNVELLDVTEAVDAGTYRVRVTKTDSDEKNDHTGLKGASVDDNGKQYLILEYQIVKRQIVIDVTDRTSAYGTVTEDNVAERIAGCWNYGVNTTYGVKLEPLAGDADALNIRVDCEFTMEHGFAVVGEYSLVGSWDKDNAAVNKNYDVVFVGSSQNGTAGAYTVTPAKIIVPTRGQELFDEELPHNQAGVEISLESKVDGVYENIIFSGYDGAAVTVHYSSRYYDLTDSVDMQKAETANCVSTVAPKIDKVGKFVIRYKIEIENHEPLESFWRVLVLKSDEAIIVIFDKEFEVQYGDGIPANLVDRLFEGDYFRLVNDNVTKEELRGMVDSAYVYGVNHTSKVGAYNIYFDLKEGAGTDTTNYEIIYRSVGDSVNSNRGKFKIVPRKLSVDWGLETDSFTFVENTSHKPMPKVSGWINGGYIELADANNNQHFYYSDTNGSVTLTVSMTGENGGDFMSVGGHSMTVAVDNENYVLDNASTTVSITAAATVDPGQPIDPIDPSAPITGASLPKWAIYAIIGGGVVAAAVIGGLAIALAKRRHSGATSDDDGFYDDYE